jgi:hypothetical protein
MPHVVHKKLEELTTTGYFTVDRTYVQGRCGITPEEQYAYDQGLVRAGVLAVNPENVDSISISCAAMAEIMLEDDAKVLSKISKVAKTKKTDEAAGKRAGKINTFSAFTSTLSHTPEVQDAYKLWVESIIDGKKGNLTKGIIQIFHDTLCEFTTDPKLQVRVIREAAAAGYTNASWVINSLKSPNKFGASATRLNGNQKQFSGVSTETF